MTDFSFIRNNLDRSNISNGYDAVSQLELWAWMKEFKPEDGEGFMCSEHPNVIRIGEKMESLPNPPGHSGCSFAITMRYLEYIAKNGMDKFKIYMTSSNY